MKPRLADRSLTGIENTTSSPTRANSPKLTTLLPSRRKIRKSVASLAALAAAEFVRSSSTTSQAITEDIRVKFIVTVEILWMTRAKPVENLTAKYFSARNARDLL
jgi:hypothetical protein